MLKIKFYSDPGHGWGAVKRKVIDQLGIADKISTYSYQNGSNAFLEEDCDLSVLITTLKEKGYEVKFKESHTNRQSKIRNYDTYKA